MSRDILIFFDLKEKCYLQLRSLRHENVNMMMGCFCHETNPALLFEYCSRGSLNEILRRQDLSLDWTFQLSLLTDLVRVFGLFRLWVYSEETVFVVAWSR
jgi:Protein tyrosine and serine/threonine kinase